MAHSPQLLHTGLLWSCEAGIKAGSTEWVSSSPPVTGLVRAVTLAVLVSCKAGHTLGAPLLKSNSSTKIQLGEMDFLGLYFHSTGQH